MKKVEFEESRRGYDKAQVDKYITLLQKAVEELEKDVQEKETKLEGKEEEMEVLRSEADRIRQEQSDLQSRQEDSKKVLSDRLAKLKTETGQKEKDLQDAKTMISKLENAIRAMKEQMGELIRENEELNEQAKKALSEASQKPESDLQAGPGMEALFRQAKETADAYIKNVQKQVQEEQNEIRRKNEELTRQAQEKADAIIEEARSQKQTELEQKIEEVEQFQKEKEAEYNDMLQEAQDMVESAKVEADGIRSQAQLLLEQAEKRKERILARAKEKAMLASGSMKEECYALRKEMEEAGEKFAQFFKSLDDTEED